MAQTSRRRMTWTAALAAATMAPAAARAADDVVATGRADPPPAATAEELLAQLEAIPTAADDRMEVDPPFAPPRRVHGEMSVAIGTGGYRSVAGSAVIPVGKNGTVGIAVELSEGGRGYYGHHYGYSPYDYGYSPYDAGYGRGRRPR